MQVPLSRNASPEKKPSPAAAAKPVHERGAEYQAEKLTGARAQRGMLPTGQPRFVYEVKWAGINKKTNQPWPSTYEPAACLIGWEVQMKAVDAAIEARLKEPQLNPARAALAAKEAAAKAKAEEIQKKRERLQRRQARRRARDCDDDCDDDEDTRLTARMQKERRGRAVRRGAHS